MVTKTPAFEKAIEDSRKLKAKPTQDELLEVGSCPDPSTSSPLSLSFTGYGDSIMSVANDMPAHKLIAIRPL